ncbi:PHP domain-containing protein [Paenactinomyces guangxiensis]|uniref:PHP domain-containing protein n=1 Tax=Paenactinomyces guangxiensis TaxID=1490290 RepID=A0A7W2A8Z1_9BACL|nr:PHP domain-containing protein [Paenactinomyces guangxiensis]MBA4496081.1 PHP domain-containing protein [Paenactinomyces guangxiensis]MBH8593169.1 PHP domain-containing protein [Paenactinomyces guangxiensis]
MRILNHLPPGTFDLHLHTTASDGLFTPSEIVKRAKQIGLQTIAITDHDSLSGIAEAVETGKKLKITVIPGVEISTRWKGKNIDILGYNIRDCEQLHQALSPYWEARLRRAEKIIQRFCALNMPITLEEVRKWSGNNLIARPHIAQAIVSKGYVNTIQEVFNHYLADGKPASVDKKELALQDGIKLIHEAGGIAVLAHPVYVKDISLVEEMIREGIEGIEVWHRNHSKRDAKAFIRLADKYDLIVTGGSDFHVEEHRMGQFTPE